MQVISTLGFNLMGLSLADANALAAKNGFCVRVCEKDGEIYMVTQDFQLNRVNVAVKDDKITEVKGVS